MKLVKVLALLLFGFLLKTSSAQVDSLILSNNNVIVGEIKSMKKSVVNVETDYSDSDFKIEWEGIKEIYTEHLYIVTLVDGAIYTGTLETISPGTVLIHAESGIYQVQMDEITFLDKFGQDFLSNFYASVGLGINLTKANDFSQFSLNVSSGYLARKWSLDMYFNTLNSTQAETDAITRTDAGLEYRYLLKHNWYLVAAGEFLSNTEQALKLRTNGRLGAGYFPSRNNVFYWGVGGGLNVNIEVFFNDTPDRQSLEAYVGSEINLFNVTDFSLLSNIYVFPSLTEAGRVRVDYMLNANYDLPLDFYIGLNFSLNYDNRPAETGKDIDYVFGATFGWKW
jgi:hypothetical protein